MTCNYQFPLADSEKQPFGPPSGVHTSRNHSFFSRQFESGTLLPNPYACRRMLHVNSRNQSHRCNFSRSTTLLATPRCSEVAVRVVQGRNRPKPIVFILLDLSCDFWSIEDTLCPLWISVTPMQLFTLYNFASNAAVLRGGRQDRLEQKP